MAQRFNPAPGWPTPPDGWLPPAGWEPDPSWPPAPEGWQIVVDDAQAHAYPPASYGVSPAVTADRGQRPWYKKKRVILPLGLIAVLFMIAALSGGSDSPSRPPSIAQESPEERAARIDPASYVEIDSRTWAQVVKDPDAHAGERYVIYGHITQFDSATGSEAFRAATDGVSQAEWYDYDHNTLVSAADPSILSELVQGDLVKMYVEVLESVSYETQIGGETTAPHVVVNVIEVTGSSE